VSARHEADAERGLDGTRGFRGVVCRDDCESKARIGDAAALLRVVFAASRSGPLDAKRRDPPGTGFFAMLDQGFFDTSLSARDPEIARPSRRSSAGSGHEIELIARRTS
jgi:hypothetical protein